VGLLPQAEATAQAHKGSPLRIRNVVPGGLRTSVTARWGTFDFTVLNVTDTDRLARVVVFYKGHPEVQYGRDIWVPAHSSATSWILVGPSPREPPAQKPGPPPADEEHRFSAEEAQILLYDRTSGQDHLILPAGDDRKRSVPLRGTRREPYTALLLDEDPEPPVRVFGQLPQPPTRAEEAFLLTRAFRRARQLSDLPPAVDARALPLHPQAFDGIDHVVLATGRLAENPAGMSALRHWVEQGGRVWAMLDLVEPEALAPLLGDALDFRVVDRVSLTRFAVGTEPQGELHDRPVEFARVLLPAGERAPHTLDGWPVWFTRRVGRGKVVVSTLGPRGWFQRGKAKPGREPVSFAAPVPAPTEALEALSYELEPPENYPPVSGRRPAARRAEEDQGLPLEERTVPAEAWQPLLTAEIGYSVLPRGTVVLVFGAALLAAVGAGVALRGVRRRELIGWLGPAAALGATAAFVVLGEISRRAVPPTVAAAQVVQAVPGKEAAVHGVLAVYRPDSGPAEFGARQGGFFDPDVRDAEGQARRLIVTDLDSWHWDNLALPAGVRFAPFRYTAPTAGPLTAVARLGPEGLEGKLTAGPFREPGDALLSTPAGRNLAVRLRPDGSFRTGSQDILPDGQFLLGAVLSDRQQRQQGIYREFLKRPTSGQRPGGPVLLAWAEPVDMPFNLAPGARTAGTALLVVPVRLERPAPGTRVSVPGPLVAVERVEENLPTAQPVPREGREAREMQLRFQLPAEVLPLEVERVRFTAKFDAPGRRVTVSARPQAGAPVELSRVDNPLSPIRVEIAERSLLRLDERGGLHLNVSISEPSRRAGAFDTGERWSIRYLELEVVGTTKGEK
jgi:hypothetical protein